MATLTPAQVYDLARTAGLSATDAVVATAIAVAESGLRTDAVGDESLQDSKWGPSIGLWQVRSLRADAGTGRSRDASRLTDPAFNARAMVEISGGGANWKPWSVYTSGRYRSHIGDVTGAIGGPIKSSIETGGGVLDQLNPFGEWDADLLGVGVRLVVTVAALGLVVAGVAQAVRA